MGPGNSTADESNGVQSSPIVYDFLINVVISMEITKQWQVQCVDINKLYNISCYDRQENKSHCTYLYHCLSH